MTSLIQQVKAKVTPETQVALTAQWFEVCARIDAMAAERRPKMKVFEVHHLTEHAREALFKAFLDDMVVPEARVGLALAAIGICK